MCVGYRDEPDKQAFAVFLTMCVGYRDKPEQEVKIVKSGEIEVVDE